MLLHFRDQTSLPDLDVCVIGAGPVGIACALAAEANGLSVLLIESGGETPSAFSASLSQADIADPLRHAPMDVASCRALGGTSRWWGGRCVPFEPIDFAHRPYAPGTEWPIRYAEIEPWYEAAARYLDCGDGTFSKPPNADWIALDHIRFDQLERWVPQIDMGKRHHQTLEVSSKVFVLLDATIAELGFSSGASRIDSITLANQQHRLKLPVKQCVLACGGLETTRLLLLAQRQQPLAFGGKDGALGRFYMGHLFGKIADIVLDDPQTAKADDFFRDGTGFARRRFILSEDIQIKEQLLNTAFWIDNPRFFDPAHKSGILSLVWLALLFPLIGKRLSSEGIRRAHIGTKPYPILRHLGNVLLSPFATLRSLAHIINDRFLSRPRKPGFLVYNRAGRYALQYHAEQRPNETSRVTLIEAQDALGVSRLAIDLRYTEEDARSVLRAHEFLDAALRKAGTGHLDYHDAESDRLAAILKQATDGFHQIGTTRMGTDQSNSIVDADCRVHGTDNLFVASSSVFPSSSQANPTFLAIAFAIRLADHLTKHGTI